MLRICILIWAALIIGSSSYTAWGFYGHRLINKMAVFTLPPELIRLYKDNIDYISEHAVDPDKRRYATSHEASRHYIDLDHWGEPPFDTLPRAWITALGKLTEYHCVNNLGDTTLLEIEGRVTPNMRVWIYRHVMPQFYEESRTTHCDSLHAYFEHVECDSCTEILVTEELSTHGILPYHLARAQHELTLAFRREDIPKILSLSTDIGHYIADAHVPLHTTMNYNGQLTGQLGIHAFWESRIPELFAHDYDFFTGRSQYIENPVSHFWEIVLHSHSLVDSVLLIEKRLSKNTRTDMQFCFDQRSEVIVRSQCAEYAKSYSDAMENMVEKQMRLAVHAVGSAWFTAWVDAGQPDLYRANAALTMEARADIQKLETQYRLGKIKGRAH